jgi:hypothetical protein
MIEETGTGVTNANSYSGIAATTTFHADRGNAPWAAANSSAQSSALIVATDYIEATWRANSEPLTTTQDLQWPCAGDTGLDKRVARATMLLALEALSGPLSVRVDRGVKATTESLDGVGSTSITYNDATPVDPYPHITAILADIATLRSGPNSVWVGRIVK